MWKMAIVRSKIRPIDKQVYTVGCGKGEGFRFLLMAEIKWFETVALSNPLQRGCHGNSVAATLLASAVAIH
jgi:hypothetical protein